MTSPTDADLLTFEDRHPRDTPAKQELIRTELGITPPRYYQRLHHHIHTHEALAADPLLVGRLRRQAAQIHHRNTTP